MHFFYKEIDISTENSSTKACSVFALSHFTSNKKERVNRVLERVITFVLYLVLIIKKI